ncbi:glutamate-rich protein 6B [Zalophus californianus]|uniref:Glutamate-rich protein 6B n=1 Tax=Zalophus californianus TaxID=9704 RepID=A0A6J2CWW5_ZALCA|nr:glutamate-rich protein 6B [Zalophus californianus]XP_027447148.1 glutamate-rich protein 6B [Zalophus californianus]
MSAENNQSSGGTSPLSPPTTSQDSTQTLYSEEGHKEEDENSERGYLSPEDIEYLEDNEYLEEELDPEEDEYLEEETFLKENTYLYETPASVKQRKHLQKKKHLEEKEDLFEKYLEGKLKITSSCQTLPHPTTRSSATSPSKGTTLFSVPPSISELPHESPFGNITPSTSYVRQHGELLAWQDRSTQTEWTYQMSVIPDFSHGEENVLDFVTKENFWNDLLNEPIDSPEAEDIDDKLLSSSYQAVFRTMLKEMEARKEQEEDIDIPVTGILESETRRKLGILMKKNFEKYKTTILWIMKKRENLLNRRTAGAAPDTSTFTFHLWNQPPAVKESVTEVKNTHHVVRHKKKLEIDTDVVQSKTEVHHHDVKLTLYPSEMVFQILFPDGSGQIHYPSGNLAMLILSTKQREFTYIILEDSEEGCVQALINNSGHATFYDGNREIWLSLSQNLGYYFPKGKHQKAWNWWDLSLHVHAPPFQSISLKINRYIKVQIRSQDKIAFCFSHQKKHICLNLGTKYKFITREVLSEMKQKAILEVEFGSTARKMQVLLGKMSRILNFLTIPDLENFIEAAGILPTDNLERKENSYLQ